MKATIPIAVTPGTKLLRLERISKETPHSYTLSGTGCWQLWIYANHDMTEGTFLRLYDDGRIDNITIDHDGIERFNFRVKDADK